MYGYSLRHRAFTQWEIAVHVAFGSNPAVGAPARHVRLAPVSSLYLSVATGRRCATTGKSRPSLDHLVGGKQKFRRNGQAERFSGLQVDHEIVLGRLLIGQ